MWPNSSIEKGLFLKRHSVIDLVNSSPNMDRFCHCERNLEFRGGNLNLDQLPKLIFHAFYYSKICFPPFLIKYWKWFQNGVMEILEFWAVSRSHVGWCGSELAGQRVSIEAELAVIQQASARPPSRHPRPRYTFATYIIDQAHRQPKLTQYFVLEVEGTFRFPIISSLIFGFLEMTQGIDVIATSTLFTN